MEKTSNKKEERQKKKPGLDKKLLSIVIFISQPFLLVSFLYIPLGH